MIRPSACRALAQAVRQSILTALPYLVGFGSVVRLSVHPYRDLLVLILGCYCFTYSQQSDEESEKVDRTTCLDARKTHEGTKGDNKDAACVPRKTVVSESEGGTAKHTTSTETPKDNGAKTNSLSTAVSVASLPNLPLVISTELLSSYLHPRDITQLACASKSYQKLANDDTVWLALWYQDFGDTLLKWDIGRKALCNSLELSQSTPSKDLQMALSRHLLILHNVKEFYFVFGQVYLNYLLAGHNDPTKSGHCLVGLHGHIFDFGSFAPYHPGLIDTILRDCGQDATDAFETVRHSRSARRLARLNCLMIDRRYVETDGRGLELQSLDPEREEVFRRSSTRPPREEGGNSGVDANVLLPRGERRRPATLERIRKRMAQDEQEQRRMRRSSDWRVYYDPIRKEWKSWNSSA